MKTPLNSFLFGVSLLSALLLVLSNSMGALAVAQLASDLRDMQSTSASLRNHAQIDMMHDAIRADVNAALLSRTGVTDIAEVRTEFSRHTAELHRRIDANKRLQISVEVRSLLRALAQPLDEYIKSADAIIKDVEAGHAPTADALSAFKTSFTSLERRMEHVSERVEQQVSLTSNTGEANATALKEVLSASTALSLGLFVLAAFFQTRRGGLLLHALTVNATRRLTALRARWNRFWNVLV